MRFLKILVTLAIIIGILGYGAYYFGTKFVSEKIAEGVSDEIENTDNLNEIKEAINNHPEMKKFIEEGADVDESTLPFTTTEEATKTIVQKVGLIELQKLQSKYENGVTQDDIQDIVNELEGKLTEEEILAIKAIAYKELNK